jgi:putative acetyltransferase
MIQIREEKPEDIAAIRRVNEKAFGQPEEAAIVDRLRENCSGLLSLVAIDGEEIVGHILFSPARIDGEANAWQGMALAPLAVLPEWQRKGIGSQLIKKGISILKKGGCPFVIVLGHPEYYPRFGFEPASRRRVRCQWEGVPDEAFMILILDEAAMKGVGGVGMYRSEFEEAI